MKRPYITVGMIGFLLLVPLALTSNRPVDPQARGAGWRLLHKLVYPAVLLGAVHFVMLRKGWQIEPLVYLALFVLVLALRLRLRLPARSGHHHAAS